MKYIVHINSKEKPIWIYNELLIKSQYGDRPYKLEEIASVVLDYPDEEMKTDLYTVLQLAKHSIPNILL